MILEVAIFDIVPGQEAAFEAQFAQAELIISQAKGYVRHELQRGIETDHKYVLLVRWETLEDHTEGFRQSPLFGQWRALIGSFFATPPAVEHFRLISER
ncbi:antibiotic biosynthesis monooxygenase family protein [Hymenobacter sp. BT491]|uniref:antibiotic biosynthesis monooxygenase family protein n=1 Tax=Hymenobacter sp. BT491 TaxID=2766779 RepID=UPI00165356B5|nr:antibiotic biosynthesis monooxygenase [Hymenobacter sp. BT491]MBC6992002.1 antibiotic biosynthesis monooxygenase [Hymenobacter sp. BT491]